MKVLNPYNDVIVDKVVEEQVSHEPWWRVVICVGLAVLPCWLIAVPRVLSKQGRVAFTTADSGEYSVCVTTNATVKSKKDLHTFVSHELAVV